jgi:hypothetical protein
MAPKAIPANNAAEKHIFSLVPPIEHFLALRYRTGSGGTRGTLGSGTLLQLVRVQAKTRACVWRPGTAASRRERRHKLRLQVSACR